MIRQSCTFALAGEPSNSERTDSHDWSASLCVDKKWGIEQSFPIQWHHHECHELCSHRGGTSGHGWLWHLWELSSGLLGVIPEFITTCGAGLWGRRKLINHVVSEICQNNARLWLMWPRRRREDCGSSHGLVQCSADSTGFRLVDQETAFEKLVSNAFPLSRISDSRDESLEVTFVCTPSYGGVQTSICIVHLDSWLICWQNNLMVLCTLKNLHRDLTNVYFRF